MFLDEADGDPHEGCEQWRFIGGKDEIALNCEMGLYLDFQVNDGVIEGCKNLELFGEYMANDAPRGWSYMAVPGKKKHVVMAPECGKQMLAEPPGSEPTYKIFEEYAADQTAWLDDFTDAFEKMMRNGYQDTNPLQDGPDVHTNVDCDIQDINRPSTNGCYFKGFH